MRALAEIASEKNPLTSSLLKSWCPIKMSAQMNKMLMDRWHITSGVRAWYQPKNTKNSRLIDLYSHENFLNDAGYVRFHYNCMEMWVASNKKSLKNAYIFFSKVFKISKVVPVAQGCK